MRRMSFHSSRDKISTRTSNGRFTISANKTFRGRIYKQHYETHREDQIVLTMNQLLIRVLNLVIPIVANVTSDKSRSLSHWTVRSRREPRTGVFNHHLYLNP